MSLTDLLHQVEAAAGPSHDLDFALYAEFGDVGPGLSASLDRALALVERKLPGGDGMVEFGKRPHAVVFVAGEDGGEAVTGRANTPALAILAALLRALISQETEHG